MTGDGEAGELTVSIRFDPDFDAFLDSRSRGLCIERRVGHSTSLKDLIESCGVPHTEVGALELNGSRAAGFSTRISDGDRIEVLPVVPVGEGGSPLQPLPDERAGFVADIHLGRTARRLRLLGFDTRWFSGRYDRELLDIMEAEGRILLTRDRRLLMNKRVVYGCCIRSDRLFEQVCQVVRRFGLAGRVKPFSRCLACNGMLEERAKATVNALLQEKTRRFYDDFRECSSCGRVYWQGSHVRGLQAFIDDVLRETGGYSVL